VKYKENAGMDQNAREIIGSIRSMQRAMKNQAPKNHFFKMGVMNMTVSQLDTMAYLYEHKKAKMSELSKNAMVKMPTMTDMINKLIKTGVVKREHDEKDRRTVWVSITKEVEKMVAFHLNKRDESIASLMKVLTEDEKKQAVTILKKLVNSLERMH
jgi:MarR family transcriptional regulator, organic hydroperoxide resistance regulator